MQYPVPGAPQLSREIINQMKQVSYFNETILMGSMGMRSFVIS